MSTLVYRFTFDAGVPFADAEAAFLLALFGAESLHGQARTRLDAAHAMDETTRTCVVDAGTPVGRDLCRLFTGFLAREFGDDAFSVERVEGHPAGCADWFGGRN